MKFVSSKNRKNPNTFYKNKQMYYLTTYCLSKTRQYIDAMDIKWGIQIDDLIRYVCRLSDRIKVLENDK